MKTTDIIKFMDDINTVISFVEGALRMDESVHFKLEDLGEIIKFSIQRGHHSILCEEIVKLDDESLRTIYAAIAAKYQKRMNSGGFSTFKGREATWTLAPTIDDKTLVEFISPNEKDQTWFVEELNKGAREKGLL